MARDHYEVLGVAMDATPDEIKRAYRTLCLRYHPDKNRSAPDADAVFQELSDAYRTLSSTASRAEYDRGREYVPTSPDDPFADYSYRRRFAEALAKSVREAEGRNVDPDALFESLFGRSRTQFVAKTPAPAAAQAQANMQQKQHQRAAMDGSRDTDAEADADPDTDSEAAGTGDCTGTAATGRRGDFASAEDCGWKEKGPDREIDLPLTLEELYTGCVKKRRLRKNLYIKETRSFVERTEVLTVTVRPGYRPGDRIRFHEASDERIGMIPADVVYIIRQLPHPRFTAVGSDLRLYVHVALVDALAGAVLQVETLSGEVVQVRTTEVITPGSTLRVHGKGLPRPGGPEKPLMYGDLVITFTVEFPQALAADDKLKIRELFHSIEARSDPSNPGLLSMRRTSSMFGGTSVNTKRSRSVHSSTMGSSAATDAACLPPVVTVEGKSPEHETKIEQNLSNAENVSPPAANRSTLNVSKSKSRKKIGFLFF